MASQNKNEQREKVTHSEGAAFVSEQAAKSSFASVLITNARVASWSAATATFVTRPSFRRGSR
jgi:hypothetical protein